MKPIPLHPNLPTPTNLFGKPVPASQWYVCPNCKKESPMTKELVGLTEEEIDAIADQLDDTTIGWSTHEFACAIENEIRAKNGF